MHTIKISNENGKIVPTKVLIDDKPLRCYSIDYHVDIASVPTVTFEIPSLVDIEINHADICFKIHPKSVEDALKILKCSVVSDDGVRRKLIKCIQSVWEEMSEEISPDALAEIIADNLVDKVVELP